MNLHHLYGENFTTKKGNSNILKVQIPILRFNSRVLELGLLKYWDFSIYNEISPRKAVSNMVLNSA